MSIDLVDVAAQYLQQHGFETSKRRLDSTTGREGIIVRRISYTVQAAYMDGWEALAYIWQVVVRSRSEDKAMSDCVAITQLLEDAALESQNNSYVFSSQTVYTSPQELRLEEAGFYAWQVRFSTTIERSRT